jgi:uncharacterized Zn-binding protein involved in type VI secretion
MGKPAARIGDMHTCPMVTPGTPPIPHVGGPITGPGCPTVLIGGLPAAVMGDMCVCVGPPDTIVLGSTGVFIGGKPAARMGDQCAHGGAIVVGCPTVLIGETSSGSVSAGPKEQKKASTKKKKRRELKSKGWHKDYVDNKELYESYINTAAAKYSEEIGMSTLETAKTLKTMMYIESKGYAAAVSKTDCKGLFQFAQSTGRAMGLVNKEEDTNEFDNRLDPFANTDAAAKLLVDSAKQLRKKSIPVTPANLYVIHQQGASLGGKLLKAKINNTITNLEINDNERKSLDLNGGENKSPEEFIDMWLDKYKNNDEIVHELEKPSSGWNEQNYPNLT